MCNGQKFLSMASTKFYLDRRNIKPGRPASLKIVLYHRCKTKYLPLDIKLMPEQWDQTKEKIKNHPDKFRLNTTIYNIKQIVDASIIRLSRERRLRSLSANDIMDYILDELEPERQQEKEKQEEDITGFLYRFNRYASRLKPGSKRTFDHTLNRLIAFKGTECISKLRFEDITVDWLKEFDNFMENSSPSRNSRNIHFRNLRTVFNDAIDDNITTAYPFRRFRIKGEVTAKRDLSVEELRLLSFYECEECAVKYRDYFMLMFYLMGINNVDLCHLKEIKRGRLEFNRQKTRHFYSMKIEPEAMALIEKYRGEEWLLDILDHWSNDEFFRRKMNKHLQRIGPVTRSGRGGKKTYAPLFPKLTTYYARHSWASIASSLDIPIETISAGLGHEYGNRITAIYINYDNRKVDLANRKVIDWVLYGKIDGKEIVTPGTPEFFGLTKKEALDLGLVKE